MEGSDTAWGILQLYLFPHRAYKPMSPALLLEVLPVAHKYDFQPALEDCMKAARDQKYIARPDCSTIEADPLVFLEMAERLQVRAALQFP